MLFNSLSFALFFPVVMAARFAPVSWQTKKIALLLLSYAFYAAWYPPHLLILWVATAVDWTVAARIARADSLTRKRLLLGVSLTTNLGMLAVFKYSAFLATNLNATFVRTGVPWHWPVPHLLLPIGISFYTFEALSYTIDVYRGKMRPTRSLLDFALFITFFPRMVAGPIMRAELFLPQCETPARPGRHEIGIGLSLLCFGLFEKVVLADGAFAPAADALYAHGAAAATLAESWVGTLAFAGQIFFDFAGYSTCAIGIGRCLGFQLPVNFNSPYAAVNFSDFWARWHISLSSWLRDYLYIPLGGNRRGPGLTGLNLMLTMLLGGLWHGAAWKFLAWGGIHGLFLVGQRLWRQAVPRFQPPAWGGAVATFTLVCFTWVFFRAPDVVCAVQRCGEMLGLGRGRGGAALVSSFQMGIVLAAMPLTLAAHWRSRDQTLETALLGCRPGWRTALLAAMVLLMIICPGQNRAFIYFQF